MMAHQEWLTSWLNDAYGMENALIQILGDHVKESEGHPELHAKIQEHLEVTKRHAEMVKSCIERLGGSTSSVKTGMSNLFGKMQGMAGGAAEDALVKAGISDFAAENFEIASYSALITAAKSVGDEETATTCQQILADEQDMAKFLETHLPQAVEEFMQKQMATHTS